jgi:hypothetical protein
MHGVNKVKISRPNIQARAAIFVLAFCFSSTARISILLRQQAAAVTLL